MSLPIRRPLELLAPHLDYVLVDGSSSMSDKWYDMMAALDSYVATCQAARLQSQFIVSTFRGSELGVVERDHRISEWVPFTEDPLSPPAGMTPLYDAINLMGRRLRDLAPENCSIVIVTDGDENTSRHTDADQARAILEWCRAQGWHVTFIGCDFNNSKQAKLLGADDSNSLGVQKRLLADAGKLLGEKRIRAAHGGSMEFSDSEKQQFGGYLAAPGAK